MQNQNSQRARFRKTETKGNTLKANQPPERIFVSHEWATAPQEIDGGFWHYEGGPDDIEYVRAEVNATARDAETTTIR